MHTNFTFNELFAKNENIYINISSGILENMISLCGRARAGKTTVASYLAGPSTFIYGETNNPLNYVVSVIFGNNITDANNTTEIRDPVWGYSYIQACDLVLDLLRKNIDSKFSFNVSACATYDSPGDQREWKEYSFADPLKKIASVIFEIDHEILLGNTEKSGKAREIVRTKEYDICGSLTGRECLEYLGTNVFRNKFDQDVWIKILQREAKHYQKILVPDVRFVNEALFLQELGFVFILIYREESDLIITEEDRKSHPSKWEFLTFPDKLQKIYKVHNNQSKQLLYEAIDNIVKMGTKPVGP